MTRILMIQTRTSIQQIQNEKKLVDRSEQGIHLPIVNITMSFLIFQEMDDEEFDKFIEENGYVAVWRVCNITEMEIAMNTQMEKANQNGNESMLSKTMMNTQILF